MNKIAQEHIKKLNWIELNFSEELPVSSSIYSGYMYSYMIGFM